jgi:hypothetical protein
MAYDGWLTYGDVELFNLSRTTQLAEALGIDAVWTDPAQVAWIETALDGEDYDLITAAPWYDADYPASGEFAGVMPLSISGLDDSTLEATITEFITPGGSAGTARNATLPIVAKVAIIASTARGADFGKRWLDRVLTGSGERQFCSGSQMRYFRWPDTAAPQAHRRDVSLTRGTKVVSKRVNSCSHTWIVTFTWTAGDPFEYGDDEPRVTNLGSLDVEAPVGAPAITSGSLELVEEPCPVFDYSPLYDPLYPTLVVPPVVPTFYPEGWYLVPGAFFTRHWARIETVEPSSLAVVPIVTLTTDIDIRMIRVSFWPNASDTDDMCDPLWEAIISYLPAGLDFVLDGEQSVAYAWDGVSEQVRRTDSLVYGAEAVPVDWASFNDTDGLLVTLDIIREEEDAFPPGDVRASVSLVPKSD